MGLGWLEHLIFAAVALIFFWLRWRRGWPHFGDGPFTFGFATVPVDDPPPPRDPDRQRDIV